MRACEALLEQLIETDPATGERVLKAGALDVILENSDDPDHVADPLAHAVYGFIRARNATLVLPDS